MNEFENNVNAFTTAVHHTRLYIVILSLLTNQLKIPCDNWTINQY